LISANNIRRYSFIDQTFPGAGLITSSGVIPLISGTVSCIVASDDHSLGVLLIVGNSKVLYKNNITSPIITTAGSCLIPSSGARAMLIFEGTYFLVYGSVQRPIHFINIDSMVILETYNSPAIQNIPMIKQIRGSRVVVLSNASGIQGSVALFSADFL